MAAYLKKRNLTAENVRESLRARLCVDEYLKQQGISEPEIPEKRIRQAYERHPERYQREESINVSHVLIVVDANAGPEAKRRARQKAEHIHQELLAGQDFAEMAKTFSECNSASSGGNLKDIKKGYMPAAFDNVAFALEKETLSDVVETPFGYHLIKVVDKQPAGQIPYEQVKDFIRKYLQEGELQKKLALHVLELKSRAKIELLSVE